MSLPSEVNPHLLASSGYNPAVFRSSRSVRTRRSASGYFSRTPASTSNRRTWTWSGWIKRGALTVSDTGGVIGIFGAGTLGTGNANFQVYWNSDHTFYLQETVQNSSNQLIWTSTPVYRDPTAWYHIVVAMDVTQATASNKLKLYVNGVLQSGSFSVTPGTTTDLSINNSVAHYIGGAPINPNAYGNVLTYHDGYFAEVYFVDGQQLTPSSFGATDAVTGVWNPIRYTGTYGTYGYYLNFGDNSAATAAAIGKDSSGNGNNWTPTNISVTAGVTNDSMIDFPVNYGTDTGLGGEVQGNYCTLSPINKYSSVDLQNAGLRYTTSQTSLNILAMGTMSVSSGKWYWEMTCTTAGAGDNGTIGIMRVTFNGMQGGTYPGYETNSVGYHRDGGKSVNGTYTPGYGASYNDGDVIGVAVDCTAGNIQYYKNGTSQGVISAGINYEWTPGVNAYNVTGTDPVRDLNFGQRPFVYNNPGVNRPSADYKCLCTQNLPTPTIKNGANHMAATTYTGTGTSLTVSNAVNGVSFQPDFVWIKNRTAGFNHNLVNSVAGATRYLESSTTAAEVNNSLVVSAITSTGFSVGSASSTNGSTNSLVAWQWKGGGTAVTNTNGSISSQVSANPTAGFSIVAYTGTGANATVGHGLGVAPSMVICKNRSVAASWLTYHASVGNTAALFLNLTNASITSSTYFNDMSPTSTVFSLGDATSGNGSGNSIVAYCFAAIAGYSAFGSYAGNSSTDGPVVYLGFRARWIMIKGYDSGEHWILYDTARNTYNVVTNELYANLSNAEATYAPGLLDITANGFKLRYASAPNISGRNYIYAAFAENPFSIARAR